MNIGLLIVGDEILSGKRADKHLPKVIELLAARGLALTWARYVGDDPKRITADLKDAFASGDLVFSCGGIGATPDDHTRQCAAAALGVPLALHPEARDLVLERMQDVAREQGKPFEPGIRMTEILEQAARIANAEMRVQAFGDRRADRSVWRGRQWQWASLRFEDGDFNTATHLDTDAREKWFYQAIGASPAPAYFTNPEDGPAATAHVRVVAKSVRHHPPATRTAGPSSTSAAPIRRMRKASWTRSRRSARKLAANTTSRSKLRRNDTSDEARRRAMTQALMTIEQAVNRIEAAGSTGLAVLAPCTYTPKDGRADTGTGLDTSQAAPTTTAAGAG